MMLDAHPELTIPPETHFIPEVIRRANHENTRRRLIRSILPLSHWRAARGMLRSPESSGRRAVTLARYARSSAAASAL